MADSSRPRKTVKLADIVDKVNQTLALTPDFAKEQREAVYALLETLLFENNAYAGYCYLLSELDSNGMLKDGYDDTRRKYSKRLLMK